jgi:hypothetical protein
VARITLSIDIFQRLFIPLLGVIIGICCALFLMNAKPHVHHVATYWTPGSDGGMIATGIFSFPARDCNGDPPIAILSPVKCLTSSKIPTEADVISRGLGEFGFTLTLNTEEAKDVEIPVNLATKSKQIAFVWKVRANECLLIGDLDPKPASAPNLSSNTSSPEEDAQYNSIIER